MLETAGQFVDMKRRAMNDRLMLAEKGFLDGDGLEGKQWFKHLVSVFIYFVSWKHCLKLFNCLKLLSTCIVKVAEPTLHGLNLPISNLVAFCKIEMNGASVYLFYCGIASSKLYK